MNFFVILLILLAVKIASAAYFQQPLILDRPITCVPTFSHGVASIVGFEGEIMPPGSENTFAWRVEAANEGFIIQSISSPDKVLTQIVEDDEIRIVPEESSETGTTSSQLFDIACGECGSESSTGNEIGVDCVIRPHGLNTKCIGYTDDAYVLPCADTTNQLFMFMVKRI
ncbi:hypothetical protein L218DRAFT_1075390 [Marasmius fiardii PR-910]|nr:hypothetical protein L218DRAFT_1075390 [Marasmius fiardii PR-910]